MPTTARDRLNRHGSCVFAGTLAGRSRKPEVTSFSQASSRLLRLFGNRIMSKQMFSNLSRRLFLTHAAVLGMLGSSARPGSGRAQAAMDFAPTKLIVERRIVEVNGKPASVFGIRQSDGNAGLSLNPSQRFRVELENKTSEPTIVHWHGQTPPPDQDGVVDTGYVPLISSSTSQDYDFNPRSGTHWMHSHHGLQEQRLMAAPLIVHTEADRHMNAQEVVVMLHDFSFRDPAEILAQLTGRIAPVRSGAAAGHDMDMAGHAMPMESGAAMDLNDIDYDAYLANEHTLEDPLVVQTERGGRVRLRLINGATTTAFWIDLGILQGTLIAVDGDPVRPITARRFPIAEAQRLDILIPLPKERRAFPVLAQREGNHQRTGIILASPGATIAKISSVADVPAPPIDLSLEQRLVAVNPLPRHRVGMFHHIALTGSMRPYVWSIEDRTWINHKPLPVRKGERVVLEMTNHSGMAHPMHLHGHHFQVIAINGIRINGAMRDTVLVPARGSVTIAFDANNPGRWLLHCHNLFHMATGMMTEIVYDNA